MRALIVAGQFSEARARLDQLDVDELRRTQLDVELFSAAIDWPTAETPAGGSPIRIGGRVFDERDLRRGLEDALRRMARLTSDAAERCRIVDRANHVRPLTVL